MKWKQNMKGKKTAMEGDDYIHVLSLSSLLQTSKRFYSPPTLFAASF
jgi:hypothetical protein